MVTGDRAVAVVIGTRPEAVKVAPLVIALRRAGQATTVVSTGQQPGRVEEALAPFGVEVDVRLQVDRATGSLNELVGEAIRSVDTWLAVTSPAAVLVQGDTSSAFAAAFAASMRGMAVIHLEAGLRTGDRALPFPEEINRQLIADLADLHLAPTPRAREALAREGHSGQRVVVTGNTVVDALETLIPAARARPLPIGVGDIAGRRLLVVTVHRRESWGEGIRAVARAVATLVAEDSGLHAVVVTHPNPAVAADVRAVLAGVPRCDVIDPLPYDDMLALLARADVVLTDSGGIQEEAPSLRIPAVVARSVTERAEGVEAGWADLVGLDTEALVAAVRARLAAAGLPADGPNPYGDGRAAERCAAAIAWLLGDSERPIDWEPSGP
jgi:UDP-N-acetylglucosamine 2-epimerase (non-hydrolysing)